MKILIIGGYGKLGRSFPWTIERLPNNIRSFGGIEYYIRKKQPTYIINCASVTGEHNCSMNIEKAYATNTSLPVFLADICKDIGARLIQFSTFYDGEGIYCSSKRLMEEALDEMDNNTIIYLPTLFDNNTEIAHYPEHFHVAYIPDVVRWTLDHLDVDSIYLSNAGYPTRQEFIEYCGEAFCPTQRKYDIYENADDYYFIEMRHWKEAVDEMRNL